MSEASIVQFVCFETAMSFDDFSKMWEQYLPARKRGSEDAILKQQVSTRARYKFISKHIMPQSDFRFVFSKIKTSPVAIGSPVPPEQHLRVVQAGGYMPVQIDYNASVSDKLVEIVVFINKEEFNISAYKELLPHNYLNIYEAYFESCLFPYILEYFIEESETDNFIKQLKSLPKSPELGVYKDCVVLQG